MSCSLLWEHFRRILLDPDRAELYRDHPYDAGTGDDLVSLAAVYLGALCHEPYPGPGDASYRYYACVVDA